MAKPTTLLTIGTAGTGKTFCRCARFIVDEFLPFGSGIHWSNFPIRFEELSKLAKRAHGIKEEEVRRRVRIIPPDVLQAWQDGTSGPWEFFDLDELAGAHIAIDEAHKYASSHHAKISSEGKTHIQRWSEFLGELRHKGGSFEFITQADPKLHRDIKQEAGMKIGFEAATNRRLLGVSYHDWFQVAAKLKQTLNRLLRRKDVNAGCYVGAFVEVRFIRTAKERWEADSSKIWRHSKPYFDVYSSYSVADGEADDGAGESRRPQHEWELFGLPRFAAWFVEKYFLSLFPYIAIAAVVLSGIWGIRRMMAFDFDLGPEKKPVPVAAPSLPAPSPGPRPSSPAPRSSPARAGRPLPKEHSHLVEWKPGDPEPTVADPADELAQVKQQASDCAVRLSALQVQLKQAREYAMALQSRIGTLEKLLDSGRSLSGISGEQVFFADGQRFKSGEVIEHGPFKGRAIVKVDGAGRRVDLDDGTVLRLGVFAPVVAEQLQRALEGGESAVPIIDLEGNAIVPEAVPGTRSNSPQQPRTGRRLTPEIQPEGGSSEPSGVLPMGS